MRSVYIYYFPPLCSKALSDLFLSCRGPVASNVTGSVAGLEGSHTLRRVSTIRRTFTSSGHAGMKRHSVALQVKFQLDSLMEQLRRTKIHFVHCFLPQHNAGLCDVRVNGSNSGSNSSSPKTSVSSQESDILMNVPLVRSQVIY
jgi:myosin-18